MSPIPPIAEQDIRHFIGEQSFLKGLQYFQNGAILHPVRQGMTLKAYCYGSLPDPYHVQVTCDETGIAAALCSCPVGTPTYGRPWVQTCRCIAADMARATGNIHQDG